MFVEDSRKKRRNLAVKHIKMNRQITKKFSFNMRELSRPAKGARLKKQHVGLNNSKKKSKIKNINNNIIKKTKR
jgi:hypothetical protein